MARVLTPQAEDFPRWYQDVVAKAQLAENGPVRGTMVIRPWAYGIWELLQRGSTTASRRGGRATPISRF
jgi:prolyl-tRNA synthetase